jgi:hypothetical protein
MPAATLTLSGCLACDALTSLGLTGIRKEHFFEDFPGRLHDRTRHYLPELQDGGQTH